MLDYTKREKKFLSVKLIDETTLFLGVPRKALYAKLTSIEEKINATQNTETIYDELLQLTADILSTNNSGKTFTAAKVDALMDIEDMALLIFEYSKFAGNIVKDPN